MVTFVLHAALLFAALALLTPVLGRYMYRVFSGERTLLSPVLEPVERAVCRVCGVATRREMTWAHYAGAVIAFNAVGVLVLYALLRFQGLLPLDPAGVRGQSAYLAFNTAVSFVCNTNWQAYGGESGASYLTQMVGLTWQNFVSAGTGLAVAIALIRGITRQSAREIGNFWVDLVRGVLYVLLPGALLLSIVLVSQGVIQNLSGPVAVTTLEGGSQTIAQGPVASQEAIKMLGTNGGGFFNANSAHPYENPTPLTNMLQILALLIIPAALTSTFGRFAGSTKQGWAIFLAMLLLLGGLTTGIAASDLAGNPLLDDAVLARGSSGAPIGSMEGKEVRFGVADSALFAGSTTAVSCGAVDMSHDSATPLAGGLAMLAMALGEIVFGGVGVGLAGMLLFAILAVFIAGLMVGRTPEFLGKKIEAREVQLTLLAILVVGATTLVGTAIGVGSPSILASRANLGPHGLSEILYAFTSASANNGSAFAGLAADTPVLNVLLGIAILLGRFFFIVPVLGIAGSLGRKKKVPASAGTFPTTGALFVFLLVGVVLIVGALTYFPAYALGPVVEHYLMHAGVTF